MIELPRIGDVIRQKYRLEAVLGQGGMAVVFAATHLHLQQKVALKLMRPDKARTAEVGERFLREARATSRLEGAHVARVLDVDTLEDGTPFIVMEHLEGSDLSVLLRRQPITCSEAAGYVRQACEGIAEAHALGIVHRDVKPANLFLAKKRSGESVVKVLDFGISKLLEDSRLTAEQVGMGSAEYMSPEQMRSARDVDARSDVWSLGVTLYELCTGHTPFHADGAAAVIAAVMSREPVPPRAHRPDMPPGLEAVILRCLEKDPARRYPSVGDLSAALAAFAPGSIAGSLAAVPAARLSSPGSAPRTINPIAAGAALGIVAVILAIVVFGVVRGRPGAAAGPRFQIVGDTVTDAQTKLTWQRRPAPAAMDWASAKAHCARAKDNYRLPTIEELRSLVAILAVEPPFDPENFTATPVDVFWSSTPGDTGSAKALHFSTTGISASVVSTRNRVRCVR